MSSPSSDEIREAASALRAGNLVVFPTETVYGLGADASSPPALRRIFELKGRPASHPLIVHIASADDLQRWSDAVSPLARRLAMQFWPGPLTLVLRRAQHVSPVVTGGQATIGLRVPSHPIAQALLREFGGGVAAPSANRFGAVSPTRAEHVRADLGAETPLLLDGGPCAVGLESTILDVSSGRAVLLRPGGLSVEQLRERADVVVEQPHDDSVRAPGRLPSHYATRATLLTVTRDELEERVIALLGRGARVGVLGPRPTLTSSSSATDVVWRASPVDAAGFARALYAELRELDAQRVDVILVVPPPAHGLGLAIADRLARAAAPR